MNTIASGRREAGRVASIALAGHALLLVLSGIAFAATPAQQEGGLTADELIALARPLAVDPACLGIDIVCYDVDMDDDERTSGRLLVEIMRRILAPA